MNGLICGHLATASIFIMSLVGVVMGHPTMIITAAVAPGTWWLAQLAEAGLLRVNPTYAAVSLANVAAIAAIIVEMI